MTLKENKNSQIKLILRNKSHWNLISNYMMEKVG